MAKWGDVWSGIGLIGQARRGQGDPLRQAYQRRGQVWSEGLGGISDTLGDIAQRKWQTGERLGGEAHQLTMQEADQVFTKTQNKLKLAQQDRALALQWDIAVMDDKRAASNAQLAKDHQQALQDQQLAYDKLAQTRALNAQEEAQLRELNQELAFWQDKLDMFGEEMAEQIRATEAQEEIGWARVGVEEQRAETAAAAQRKQEALINMELAKLKEGGTIATIYEDVINAVAADKAHFMHDINPDTGQPRIKPLSLLTDEQLKEVRATFETRIMTDHKQYAQGLWNIFDSAAGQRGKETEVIPIGAGDAWSSHRPGLETSTEPYTSVKDFAARQGIEFLGDVTRQWDEFLNDLDRLGVGKIFGRHVGGTEEEQDAINKLRDIRKTLDGTAKEEVNTYIQEIGADTITPTERINEILNAVRRLGGKKKGDENLPLVGQPLIGTEIQFR